MPIKAHRRRSLEVAGDSDVLNWALAVYAADSAAWPSGAYLNVLSTFWTGLKTAASGDLTALLDAYWPLGMAENATQAYMPLKFLTAAAPQNGMVFTAKNHVQGNGTTRYVDLNYNPATDATVYAQNDASLGVRIANDVLSSSAYDIGAQDATNRASFRSRRTGDAIEGRLNRVNGTSDNATGSITTSAASFIFTRRGASDSEIYFAGASVAALATASNGVPNGNLFLGALNLVGTPGGAGWSTRQYRTAFVGGALSDAQAAEFVSLEDTFITSVMALP